MHQQQKGKSMIYIMHMKNQKVYENIVESSKSIRSFCYIADIQAGFGFNLLREVPKPLKISLSYRMVQWTPACQVGKRFPSLEQLVFPCRLRRSTKSLTFYFSSFQQRNVFMVAFTPAVLFRRLDLQREIVEVNKGSIVPRVHIP